MLGKTEGKWEGQHRMRWLDSITSSRDMSLSNEPLLVLAFAAFLGLPTTWASATIISPTEAPATGPQSQVCAHHWLQPPPLLVMIPRLWNRRHCWGHQLPFQWQQTPCNTCQTPHSCQCCGCQQPEPNSLMFSQTQCHLMPLHLAPYSTLQCAPTQRWKAFSTEIRT